MPATDNIGGCVRVVVRACTYMHVWPSLQSLCTSGTLERLCTHAKCDELHCNNIHYSVNWMCTRGHLWAPLCGPHFSGKVTLLSTVLYSAECSIKRSSAVLTTSICVCFLMLSTESQRCASHTYSANSSQGFSLRLGYTTRLRVTNLRRKKTGRSSSAPRVRSI